MFLGIIIQREYEEFKIRINALVAKAQKVPEEGWIMQDGTPWPGNNTRDHPGMIQVTFSSSLLAVLFRTNDISVAQLSYTCLTLVLRTSN